MAVRKAGQWVDYRVAQMVALMVSETAEKKVG
jgi:hypothetical protein